MKRSYKTAVYALCAAFCLSDRLGAEDQSTLDSMSLEQLMGVKVETASMHAQSIGSAPGAVSVVTAADIRKYGYRTLADVLNHVRGFFITYDRTYYEANTGGFSIPGDWSTRVLVLLNGHVMTDNIFGSASYLDEDFIVDMSLVDRIEIVRGPSSALYGSNGILATINVITRKPDNVITFDLLAETSSLTERKVTATENLALGKHASLLFSGSFFNNVGNQDIYIPELSSPATNFGHAINMDNSRGYRFFAKLAIGNWQFLSALDSRQKIQPISWNETIFNDRGTRTLDQRFLVDALYTHSFDDSHVLQWRTYYDHYDYHGIYDYPLTGDVISGAAGIDLNKEFDAGDWVGSQLSYRHPFLNGALTEGVEGKFDLRALESVADVQPVFHQDLMVNKLDKFADGFVQQEWNLGRHWILNAGGRYDWTEYRHQSISPRISAIYQPDKRTALKFMYGRGFRNPNANELFFNDGQQFVSNPNLKPERADNLQVDVERSLGRSWTTSLSLYRMWDSNVIVPTYDANGVQTYENASSFRGQGIGLELAGRLRPWLEVSANFQKQHASLDGGTLPNSPGNLGKAQFAVPLQNSRLMISGGLLYQSERRSLNGVVLSSVYLPEITVEARRLLPNVDLQFGLRNLSNYRYSDPIGLVSTVDTMMQDGRTWFLTLRSHVEERSRTSNAKNR